jgi:hypothetical protein
MSESIPVSSPASKASWLGALGIALAGVLVCSLAISHQSYWIDETDVVYKARLPSLADWWGIISQGGSELQQPLYPLMVWGLGRFLPLAEFTVRCLNVVWFIGGSIVAWFALVNQTRLRWAFLALLLCSPFAWYYLNEARPYTLQLGASLVVFCAIYRLSLTQNDPKAENAWIIALCIGTLILAASGMLAMLWLGAYLMASLVSAGKARLYQLGREHARLLVPTALLLLCMGFYYLWTVSIGARATDVGTTDIKNLMFILFELFGFSGLGPGRLEIRTGGFRTFLPWLPYLTVYSLVLLPLLVSGVKQTIASTSWRTRLAWVLCFTLVAGFIAAVGATVRFRVLGRHFTPLLPIILFILASGAASLLQRRNLTSRLVFGCFLLTSLVSCGLLRFSERHAKEDYRGAARLAREAVARGQVVWWNAYDLGALVYDLELATQSEKPGAALLVQNPSDGFAQQRQQPDLVLVSKPDLFDKGRALQRYLETAGFKRIRLLSGFSVWQSTQVHPQAGLN